MNTKEKRYRDLEKQVCPPSAPKYVKGEPFSDAENGRCCAGPTNADRTACVSDRGSCDVTNDPNIFKTSATHPNCQLLKAGACPERYTPIVEHEGGGPYSGLTLSFCYSRENNKFCSTKAIKDTLIGLGYPDISQYIPVC
jgi:hypothetical protein